MKSTELRIGNWVTSKSSKFPWEVLSTDINIISVNESHYEPIQLTEEWLLKFGFTEKYKSIHNNWTKGGSKIFQLYDYEDEEGELRNEFYYEGNIHVKHVHQLQNLYFALCGEELTIKD